MTKHQAMVVAAITASLVVVAVVATRLDPRGTDGTALLLLGGWVTALVLGIVVFWWWAMLRTPTGTEPLRGRDAQGTVPPLSTLKTWPSLAEAMTVTTGTDPPEGGDRTGLLGWDPVLWWLALVWTPAALLPVAFFWLRVGEVPPFADAEAQSIMITVVALAVYGLAMGVFLSGRSIRDFETEFLGLLGLAVIETPGVTMVPTGDGQRAQPTGGTIVAGSRRDMPVRIETDAHRNRTSLEVATEAFRIESEAGKLQATEPTPAFVAEGLRGLRKAERWVGIEVTGGPDGMHVERRPPDDRDWLYDLWLLERLAEARGTG